MICKACKHPQLAEINSLLLTDATLQSVADKFGLSVAGTGRHKRNCLLPAIGDAIIASDFTPMERKGLKPVMQGNIDAGGAIMDRLAILEEDAKRLQGLAESAENFTGALTAIREQSRLLELFVKLSAEAREREKLRKEDWQQSWGEIKEVLEGIFCDYPEAWELFKVECIRRGVIV